MYIISRKTETVRKRGFEVTATEQYWTDEKGNCTKTGSMYYVFKDNKHILVAGSMTGGRTISLQERTSELLKDCIRDYEKYGERI